MKLMYIWIQINVLLLLPIIGSGLLMSVLSKQSDQNLRMCFGWNSVVVTGAIGTPIHELSHMIVAIIFGFKITDVKLFCPVSGRDTGVLGYVSYKYRKTFWGKIGNFFVGIAPMVGGSLVIYCLFRMLLPSIARQVKILQMIPFQNMSISFLIKWIQDSVLNSGDSVGHIILFLILLIMISMHMSISGKDLKNASYGAIFLEVLLLGISILLAIMNITITDFIWQCAKMVWMIMLIGLLAAIISSLITSILRRMFS